MSGTSNRPILPTPPTEKMLSAAQKAAIRHMIELPADVAQNFEECKAFLDKYLNLPSQKQLDFAKDLARSKGISLPEDLLSNSRELSAWIDQVRLA